MDTEWLNLVVFVGISLAILLLVFVPVITQMADSVSFVEAEYDPYGEDEADDEDDEDFS